MVIVYVFFVDLALDDWGYPTYVHELPYSLDYLVAFNNHGRWDDTRAKFYVYMMPESSYMPAISFNLNFSFDER